MVRQRSTTRNSARDLIGCENQTQTRLPRRPCSMAFDLLHQDGRELTGRPLRDRRARLENAVAGSDMVLPVRRLAKNGYDAWAEVIAHDCEGLVAKEESSLYEA